MFEPHIETRARGEQFRLDDEAYRRQIACLFEKSRFYRRLLTEAGFKGPHDVGGLDAIAGLPFTEKDDLRRTRTEDEPVGTHLAAPMSEIVRVFSTSGTTGTPSYIPLTLSDLENWVRTSSRSYTATGMSKGRRVVSTYNAGPFVAGAALDSFTRIGACHIPVGTGNSERLMTAVRLLKPHMLVMTPSYALYLAEWARDRGIDTAGSSIERVMVAGEPGGGESAMRARLEELWGATVAEAMGIGDISVSLWGECDERNGMHFCGQDFVHVELIDPDTGAAIPIEDGARGELVYTHLRHQAAPLLRFRSRDHVQLWTGPCACGRTGIRVRCIGRTDDMLIVRGVNVFPTAVREIVNAFAPTVSGVIAIRPASPGVKQEPPLPIRVELAEGQAPSPELAESIRKRIRDALVVNTRIELVAWGSLPRSEYKSKLVDRTAAGA